MAKKTEAQKRKEAAEAAKRAKDKKNKGLSSDAKSVKSDLETGQRIGNELGFNDPLSRFDVNIPEDQRRFIEAQRERSDPNSAAFVGGRSDEEKQGLGFLENLMNGAGVRSSETTDVISRAKNAADVAGRRSEQMAGVLKLMEGGLAGLNASENQAIREQAQREVDRKRQTAVEAAQTAARTGGLRGGAKQAALRGANRDAMMAQADMEQKNLVSNIDIQDKRRTGYADTLNTAENSEFDRGDRALNTYGETVSDAEASEFDRKERSGTAFNNRVGELRAGEFDRTDRATNSYGDSLGKRNDYFLETGKANMNQERTERAAKAVSATGLSGLVENERQRRKDARKSKGDGRDAGKTGTSETKAYDPMEYYNEVDKIYKQSGAI